MVLALELDEFLAICMRTRQAQRMVKGRPGTAAKPAIMGLIGFANRLRVIWQGARADDPYADWWLVKIHDALDVADQVVQASLDAVQTRLTGIEAISATPGASVRPIRTPLRFSNPYAYRGAQLVAEYDRLVCTALTARHIGLLEGQACVHIQRACARKLRALFLIPQSYRLLKIDRETVRTAMGRSAEARQRMGELPADILSGERQAPLVPRKMKFPTGIAGGVGLRSEPTGPHPQHADAEDPENHDS